MPGISFVVAAFLVTGDVFVTGVILVTGVLTSGFEVFLVDCNQVGLAETQGVDGPFTKEISRQQ